MRTLRRVRGNRSNASPFRVGSLLMLAALVWMLWSFARQPGNWQWFVDMTANSDLARVPPEYGRPKSIAPEANPLLPEVPVEVKPKTSEPPVAPLDEEPEQQAAAAEEFQAITDGTLEMRKEEMPAYWRLFSWVKQQTPKQMIKRAQEPMTLNDMLRRSDSQRGKLVKLDLNLRRVLSYEAAENPAGIETVYELWGFSNQTKSWLYVGLTAEVPAQMPRGADINERVTFVGYFLKVQGYQAAKSRPNEKPLSAPLLVGRIVWQPTAAAAPPPSDPGWLWLAVAGGGASFLGIGWYVSFYWRKPVRKTPQRSLDFADIQGTGFPCLEAGMHEASLLSDQDDSKPSANESSAPYFSPK